MIISDYRYERLRHLLMRELAAADAAMAAAAEDQQLLAFESAQDDAEEWALMIQELDAAAPAALRLELGIDVLPAAF